MKKSMKKLLVLTLSGVLALGAAFTVYAEQWIYEETEGKNEDGTTYTETDYYLLDDAGQRITGRAWEGGALLADGSLYIDEVWVEGDRLMYWRNTNFAPAADGINENGYYYGTLDWKYQMLSQWKNTLKEESGTYTMDYQLPADWSEQCPSPIMTATVDYVCFDKWGGWGYVNWTDSWRVDENNVIHMTATYN